MNFSCPNKNTPEWNALLEMVGGDEMKAYKAFIRNDYNIPTIEREIDDKIGKAVIDALKVTTTRIKILEGTVKKGRESELKRLKEIEHELVNKLINEEHEAGLLYFTKQLDEDIASIRSYLTNTTGTIGFKSSRMRTSLSYINAVLPMMEDITKYLVGKTNKTPAELEIYASLTSKRNVLESLRDEVLEDGREIVSLLLEPLIAERNNPKLLAEINKGLPPNKQLKEFDLLTSLKQGEGDNNILDRWFRSLANNSDELLRIINEVVMRKKTEARLEALKDKYRILQIRDKYIKSTGDKDLSWMYEKTRDGKLTGNFIGERRYNEYFNDMHEFQKKSLEKYGVKSVVNLNDAQLREYQLAVENWKKDNSDYKAIPGSEGKIAIPSMSKYGNEDYANLNEHQRAALKEMRLLKTELDNKIHPKFRHKNRAPQVGKDFYERVKSIKNLGDVKEIFRGEFYNTDRDTDQGMVDDASVAYVLEDGGREVEFVPMHFTKKLNNMDTNLSTDIVSNMVVYSHMARDYQMMNSIVDSLEVTREVLRQRKFVKTDNSGKVKKAVKYIAGTKLTETLFKDDNVAFDRFEDFLSMIVYGKTRVNRGNINLFGKDTGIDKEKAIDMLGRYTAINSLALNVYAGIANLGTGSSMLRIEAAANKHLGKGSVDKANVTYWKHLPAHLGQIGNVKNTSKLNLWSDMFDPLQDFKSEMHKTNANRTTWFTRSLNGSALFFMSHAGEHFLQTRTSLALAHTTKVKDKDGKEMSLWDAYEVKDDMLKLKDGITKLDGSKWTREDEITFMRRQDFLNQRMHGIYNHNDMAAVQKYAIGRLALMFRKFMVPGWDRRWEKARYNYMLGDWTEGYYWSTAHFMGQVMKDLVHLKFSLIKNWNNLSDLRKANVKKTMADFTILLGISLLLAVFLGGDDDHDEWYLNMMDYQAHRILTELMFFWNPGEALLLLRSPMAAVQPIQNAWNFIGSVINPFKWTDKYESGRYEDWYKWQKQGLILLPFYRTIDRAMHPDEAKKFFNN